MDTFNIELDQEFTREIKRLEDSIRKNSSAVSKFFGAYKLSDGEKAIAERFFWRGIISYLEIKHPDIVEKLTKEGKYPLSRHKPHNKSL